ncbi:MAG: DMT family transporter [Candidatus Peribacteraceae bacterium]
MSLLSKQRRGELAIFLSATLWSLFPVVTILILNTLPPLYTAALSTLAAAMYFAVILSVKGRWHELLRREAWSSMFMTSLLIGVFFYGFFITGLRFTTAGNASILALMEVFFSYLILGILLSHEHVSRRAFLGSTLLVLGAAVVLLPNVSTLKSGDFLIVLATLFGPMGNVFAQRARSLVSTETVLFFRSIMSGCVLLVLALLLEPPPASAILLSSTGFIVLNGIFLFAISKVLWLEGIRNISITKAISLESLSPALTLLVAYFVLGEHILPSQVFGFLPMVAGVLLLTTKKLQDALTT